MHLLAALACCALLAPALSAQPVFTQIADTNTVYPGSSDNFALFNGTPVISGSSVYFNGVSDNTFNQGIFSGSGGALSTQANHASVLPGSGGQTAISFEVSAVGGGVVAFVAQATDASFGLYTSTGGTLNAVANGSTAIPGGTGNFASFGRTRFEGAGLIFTGGAASAFDGLYRANGSVTRVGDQTSSYPGGGNFGAFDGPSPLSGNRLLFAGTNGALTVGGVTVANGGSFSNLVTTGATLIPGGSGSFLSLNVPATNGTEIVFNGFGSGGQAGIYGINSGSTLSRIVDRTFAAMGGVGSFSGFGEAVLSGGLVAFCGFDANGNSALYTVNFDSSGLQRIVGVGDALGGRTVSGVSSGISIDGSSLGILVNFVGGSSAVYRVDLVAVPEPTTLLAAALGLGLVLHRWRGRTSGR